MSQTHGGYPPVPGQPGPRQLRRSRTDRYLGGVCGGLARYLNADPTLVRILTVVVTLFTAVPVLLYVLAWLLVPEEDVVPAVPPTQPNDPVWGAGGPPWAPSPGAQPQPPNATPAPTDPPRAEDRTA